MQYPYNVPLNPNKPYYLEQVSRFLSYGLFKVFYACVKLLGNSNGSYYGGKQSQDIINPFNSDKQGVSNPVMLLCVAQTLALTQPTSGSFLGHTRLGLADLGRAASVVTAGHVLT